MNSLNPYDQLVSLTTAPNPVLAHIWENALREKGIDCQVVGDFLDAGIGDISGVLPEIWIKLEDMTQAQALLGRCPQIGIRAGHQPSRRTLNPRRDQLGHVSRFRSRRTGVRARNSGSLLLQG
jgi:hypothetical protein